ncbi:response regulator transcription factor [Tabrizicola sp. J26]|uniref:response regulator transcription factor n=1 Tax=Alitabrizicola rongguiensis TaxID=2909234 RepID=UPI001F3FB21E|nr:response regulator transcription factor [Tabrizicola rongguiensis]MCF1709075.1 response regulator transcription factor [Tabrizicola rongguiensis]
MRILLADDHDLVRETIAAFLKAEGFEAVKVVGSLQEAMGVIVEQGPIDLVLLDYSMPGMNGLEGMISALKANGGKPVAILSGFATREVAEAAMRSGAAGFLPKTLGSRAMVAAVRAMANGDTFLPYGELSDASLPAEGRFNLSRREQDVLRGICEGKSNKEIARDHDLQEVTVKLHVKTLSRKLGAKNRTHAAMIARDFSLL